jgi:uncharacterized repeat protein (TIGR01451 family)
VAFAAAVPSADVSVTKTGSPNPVSPGANLTYTITVANAGPDNAVNVVLTDVLPPSTTFVSFAFGAVSCGVEPSTCSYTIVCAFPTVGGTGTVTCSIDTVYVLGSATFIVVVKVDANTFDGTTIRNTATVSSSTADPDPTNNTAIEMTLVRAADPDLAVTMSGSPDPVAAGGNITYAITVHNAGPADAAGVVLDDPLPAGTTFVSLSAAQGWTCSTPPAGGTGRVSCGDTLLPNGASATFALIVQVNSGTPPGTVITNIATVSYTLSDPNPANNVATATTTVAP